jgi:hypothetical protein
MGVAISFGGGGSDEIGITTNTVSRIMKGISAQTKSETCKAAESIGKTAPDFGVVLIGDMARVSTILAKDAARTVKAECVVLTVGDAGRGVVGKLL